MKKIIFIFLLVISISFVVFLSYASDYGTNVQYVGSGIEEYLVTIPAKMYPNTSSDVVVEGQWASNRVVNVTADESVELINTLNITNKTKLDVNFNSIKANGDDLESKKIVETILVGDLDAKMLFGSWKGNFDYNVEIVDEPREIYYGITYANTYATEGYAPFDFVMYKDKSTLRVFEDKSFDKFEPGYIKIENSQLHGIVHEQPLSISKDKSTLTLNDSNGDILMEWKLIKDRNVVDNAFPINVNFAKITDNYKFGADVYYVKISDVILSEQELMNIKGTITINGETDTFDVVDSSCYNDRLCIGSEQLVSVKEPHMLFDNMFISEPGLYFLGQNIEGKDVKLELTFDSEESDSVKWNTLEVRNNKVKDFNGHELVKISSDVKDNRFYQNNYMNITVDGHIVNSSYSTSHNSGNIYKHMYDWNNNTYKYVIVVNEPGIYEGVTFDEVGVYAFNFGKYAKNYNINIGKQYSPTLKNNIKFDGKYIYNNQNIKFDFDGEDYSCTYVKDSSNGDCYVYYDGNILKINSNLLGIVSKDGNSIKLYKYLSEEWPFNEEEVVFKYVQEESKQIDTLYNVLKNSEGTYTKKYTGEHQDSYIKPATHDIYHFYAEDDTVAIEILNKNNVIFANHCWQMLRTTDTGGVKLIYNGEPDSNGSCGTDRGTHVGYSGITYYTLNSNYYYADDYTYDSSTGKFKLSGTKTLTKWTVSTYKDLIGKYTCMSSNENTTCSTLYLVESYYSSTQANMMTLNTNSHYSQFGTMSFNQNDNSPAYVGYMYGDIYIASEILNEDIIKYHYGESVTYNNGIYTLVNPKTFTNIPEPNDLSYNHYICLTQNSSICTSIGYIYYYQKNNSSMYYITLKLGETDVNTALNNMLTKNITNSTMKNALEYWYKKYLLEYSKYKINKKE